MTPEQSTLELRLVAALNERAAALPHRSLSPPPALTTTTSARRPVLAGIAIAAAIVAVALLTLRVLNEDSMSARCVPRIATAATTPEPTPDPAGVSGQEASLTQHLDSRIR